VIEHEHVSVMPNEVIEYLAPRPDGIYFDGTAGAGGHSQRIVESAPGARVVAVDRDPAMLEIARNRLAPYGDRATLMRASYEDVLDVLAELNLEKIDGMLIDTGPSRDQLAGRTTGRGRGFSLHAGEEPLLMAYDPDQGGTARELLARLSEDELREVFRQTLRRGEIGRVVRAIVRERDREPIETPGRLTRVLEGALGRRGPDTEKRVAAAYLALRIAVNDELEGLSRAIDAAVEALRPGGRLVLVTFHGLEHRIARQRLRELEGGPVGPPRLIGGPEREAKMKVLTPKPLYPSEEEVQQNPAARSARLHAAERV
jgi:16S rRNA (cytosine1402-N4)-methyltransferase